MDLAMISGNRGTDLTFILLMLCALITGMAGGLMDGTFAGLALYLPAKYYQVRFVQCPSAD